MNSETLKSLNSDHHVRGKILFDNEEISIQREIKQFRIILVIGISYIISFSSCIIGYFENENQWSILSAIIISIALIVFFAIEIPIYFKARKMNGRIFRIPEILRSEIKEKEYRAWIAFEFKDGTKDNITITRGNNYPEFIDTLNRNNIEIIRTNKR